jgi:hypothetical protein
VHGRTKAGSGRGNHIFGSEIRNHRGLEKAETRTKAVQNQMFINA